ncbi:MAG: T9SS type A sorting domain-containing protein [Saprospiraceae bacterium]
MKNILALLLLSQLSTFAQPSILWENSFGGKYTDYGADIIEVENGNYLVLNMPYSNGGDVLNSHGGADFWLLKLNHSGELIWQRCYGGTKDDEPKKIIPTLDGNYLLIGSTKSNDGNVTANHGWTDAWIIKIDPNGGIIWQKTYGGTNFDAAHTITPAHNGGYVVTGSSYSADFDVPNSNKGISDLWAFKIDENGTLLWSKLYGGNFYDDPGSVLSTVDGGYIFAGSSSSTNGDGLGNHGDSDSWVIKVDSIGTKQWVKVFGGEDNDVCTGVVTLDDGGYLVLNMSASKLGSFNENHGGFDFWLYELSSTGGFIWQKFYGGTQMDLPSGIKKLTNGYYILWGHAQSADGDLVGNLGPNAWMVCINQAGDIIWKRTYGGTQSDQFSSLVESGDGSITVVGHSGSNDGDVQSGGGPSNAGDVWVVHFDQTTSVKDPNAEQIIFNISPNPASNNIELTTKDGYNNGMISISTVNGILVQSQTVSLAQKVDISGLAAGAYIIKLELDGKVGYGKLIKI